ncbi:MULTISPECIES: phosphopantetheine-binding protein [unclassified Pseudoalteromonas]|uniref:phosphopantetheine-binding protein n=1 Tax=unclassified Pseudoalteromonas TaxID=194690 RepID=UPI0025B48F9A|nr:MULTISPECIES: phosphopantetheine-binding protein [unclassified Pseudoalteromonas]MDN3379147.1 phosphopantetheine-binding protein [Pseudoalteromonas sp. APC 3893]MDN3387642.1 phosphopantetheine-binding protein [Pseudoalteromonas sp. APC 4017]
MDSLSIFQTLVRHASHVLTDVDANLITRDSSLVELGANSMERSEILLNALEEMDISIPVVSLFGPKNLGELSDKIEGMVNLD